MDSTPNHSSHSPANPLTQYLLTLRQRKDTLPYGQLICISASPNITTTAALLRLAEAVGPFIAVLQVHADIIDDWSPPNAAKLVQIARNFGFLLWEGGRVLNPQRYTVRNQTLSSKEVKRDIDLARNRYTKGIVSVASWAGLASTWVPGPEEERHGGDRLIPTLRRAAREEVTPASSAVKTEISAETDPETAHTPTAADEVHAVDGHDDWRASGDNERKTSVISFTHTITQHTEVGDSVSTSEEDNIDGGTTSSGAEECEDSGVELSVPGNDYLRPPALGRGIVICLAPRSETDYNETCTSLARTHSDFVTGFVSEESWVDLPHETEFLPTAEANGSKGDDNVRTLAVFAPLESEHVFCSIAEPCPQRCTCPHEPELVCLSFSRDGEGKVCPITERSGTKHREMKTLHEVIARALAIRAKKMEAAEHAAARPDGIEYVYIPVISMNA